MYKSLIYVHILISLSVFMVTVTKIRGKLIGIALVMLVLMQGCALAATGNFTLPSFQDGWKGLPVGVQDIIKWCLAIAFAFLIIVALGFFFLEGGIALINVRRGDAAGRSSSLGNLFIGVVVVVVVLVASALVLYLVA